MPRTREPHCGQARLKSELLQDAIFKSTHFSTIATDEKGAERMLGYSAMDVLNRVTPADMSDPDELIARAEGLEPHREFRRLFGLSYAAMAGCSSAA